MTHHHSNIEVINNAAEDLLVFASKINNAGKAGKNVTEYMALIKSMYKLIECAERILTERDGLVLKYRENQQTIHDLCLKIDKLQNELKKLTDIDNF